MPRLKVLMASAAAALLLVGVVVVRGGTAAGDADLAAEPAPTASAPVDESVEPDALVLEANGFPGLRLNTSPAGLRQWAVPSSEQPCGLDGWSGPKGGSGLLSWDTSVWTVDGRVVALLLSSWETDTSAPGNPATWLGPTLGSPIAAAAELPGARTGTHAPFGDAGPTVTVVSVDVNGVEVVYGDAPGFSPLGPGDEPRGAGGRVTSVELRLPAADRCDLAALLGARESGPGPRLTVDPGGIGTVRLGAAVDPLLADGVLAEEEGFPSDGPGHQQGPCGWYRSSDGLLNVQTIDGLVSSVGLWGPFDTTFGLPVRASTDDLRRAFPELAPRGDLVLQSSGAEVDLGGTTARFDLAPETRAVPGLDRAVHGGTVRVSGVTLSDGGEEGTGC